MLKWGGSATHVVAGTLEDLPQDPDELLVWGCGGSGTRP